MNFKTVNLGFALPTKEDATSTQFNHFGQQIMLNEQ